MMRLTTFAKVGLLAVAGGAAYAKLVRPWYLRWGATDEEVAMALPGDEFAPDARLSSTRAITIDAPPEDVWPWIAQLGQDKAGFYSYRWLENLVGSHMPNVRRVVPAWQHISVGDQVKTYPTVGLDVVSVEPNRTLVLARDWSFHLLPLDGKRTRLIVRGRGYYENPDPRGSGTIPVDLGPVGNLLYWRGVFEPAHFIMERRMMLGIKALAEEHALDREAAMLVGVA